MFSASLSTDPEHNDDLHHVRYIKVRQDEGVPGSEYCDRALRVYLGPHLCIVKEPCGPTLAALQEMQPHGSFVPTVTPTRHAFRSSPWLGSCSPNRYFTLIMNGWQRKTQAMRCTAAGRQPCRVAAAG